MSNLIINKIRSLKTGDEIVRVCRGCLATGCLLYDLREKHLETAFGDISGLPVGGGCNGLVCGICLYFIRKFKAFRQRCINTSGVLGTLCPETENDLKLLDRKHLKLQINLVKTDTEIIDYEPYDTKNNPKDNLVVSTTLHIDIPVKNDIDTDDNVKIEYNSHATFNFHTIKLEPADITLINDDDIYDIQKDKIKKEIKYKDTEANQIIDCYNHESKDLEELNNESNDDNALYIAEDTLKDPDYFPDEDDPPTTEQSIDNEELNSTEPRKSNKNDDQALIKEMANVFRRIWRKNKDNVYAMFERVHKESLALKNGEKLSGKHLNVESFWEKSATYNFLELNKQLSDIYNVDIDFVSIEELKKEMDVKRSSGDFEQGCNFCCKKYNYSETYERHLSRNHDNSLPMECEICRYRFKLQRQLVGHLLSTHARQIKCRDCGISNDYWNNVKEHSEYHRGVAQTCQFCGKKFTVKKLYLMHLRGKHRAEMPAVECLLCGDTFNGKDGLKIHMHWIHKQAVQCQSCGVWFLNKDTLAAHLTTDGNCRPDHSYCPLCGATFATADLMKEHHKQQHSEYECKHCLKTFITVKSYKLHKRRGCGMRTREEEKKERNEKRRNESSKEDLQLVCEFCGKNFKHKALLKVHHRTHTGEKPYECEQCHKRFATLTSLKTHVKIHSSERPYSCTQCQKTFRQPGHLQAHQVSHTKEKAHECSICHKRFTQRGNMQEHVRTLHEGLPPKTRSRRRAK